MPGLSPTGAGAGRRWSLGDLSQEDRVALADEQLLIVWGHSRLGLWVATAFALMFAFFLEGQTDPVLLRAWVLAKLLVAAARLWQAQQISRGARGPTWQRRTLWWLAADGLIWGVAGAWLVRGDLTLTSLVAAILACVACVATFGLQSSAKATAAYVVPMVVPTALGLLARLDEVGWLAGSGALLLLGLQLATSAQSQRRLADSLMVRRQAQQLAVEKQQALQLALRQSAVKSQFLGSVSHELRTPLHGMLGLARLLRHELPPTGPALERLELLEGAGQHLLSLINDLLEVSRGEVLKPRLDPRPFQLGPVLDAVVRLHRLRAHERGLQLHQALEGVPPGWVLGDPRRLAQVLHNLVGNAVKFTDEGQVSLRGWRDEAQALQVFEVQDSGPGIPRGAEAQIFETFARADHPLSASKEGAGLGLPIARELARAMGGDVTLVRHGARGACFQFSLKLPLTEAPAPDEAPQAASVAPGPVAEGELAGRRVLLAEDDEVNALIATTVLQQAGLTVLRVNDGRSVVQAATAVLPRPDLVLMDCRMPELDGYAATREVRHQEYVRAQPRVPIVALTATVTDLGRLQAMEAGMDDFLSKPFTPEQLLAVVRAWLREAPAA